MLISDSKDSVETPSNDVCTPKEIELVEKLIEFIRSTRPAGYRGLWLYPYKITPALARALNKRARPNERPRRPARVAKYVREILNDEWVDSADPVMLDKAGLRANAQHRCYSVVEANIAIMMMVAVDVPEDVIAKHDTGVARPLSDRMVLQGILPSKDARRITSIAAAIYQGGFMRPAPSDGEQWAFVEEFKDYIFEIDQYFVGHRKGVGRAAVIAALTRVLVNHPTKRDRLKRMAEILNKTETYDKYAPGEPSVMKLHQALINSPWKTGAASNAHIYRQSARAIQAFIKGENLSKLHEATTNHYPLPSDPPSKEFSPLKPLKDKKGNI